MRNQQQLDLLKQGVATTEPGRPYLAPAMQRGLRLLIDPIQSAC